MLCTAPLVAQARGPDTKPLEVSSDLSFIKQTGNTEITTTGFGEKITLRPGWRWTITQYSGLIYGKNDGEVKAESYRTGLNVEMAFSPFIGAYGSVAFERNVFSGLAARYTYSTGFSAFLVDIPNDRAKLELGLARINERATTDVVANFFSGRAAGEYRHNFRPGTYVREVIKILPNLRDVRDLRLVNVSEIVAPISSHIGLKVTYVVKQDYQPEPGFQETDTTLQTGLQITF